LGGAIEIADLGERTEPRALGWEVVVKMKKTDWDILIVFTFCAAVALLIVWRLGW